MKKIIVFVVLALTVSISFAKENKSHKGKLGMSFYFTEFDLKSYQKQLAGTYWINPNYTIDMTAWLIRSHDDTEELSGEITDISVECNICMKRYFNEDKMFSPFLGIGLGTGYKNVKNTQSDAYYSERNFRKKEEDIRAFMPLGITYFPFQNMSVSLEYDVIVEYSDDNLHSEGTTYSGLYASRETNQLSSYITTNRFLLIATFYFQ